MLNLKKIFFSILFLIIIFFIYFYLNIYQNEKKTNTTKNLDQSKIGNEINYNANIILDVEYNAQDQNGNVYLINAKKGEIDLNKNNIIFLTDVVALVNLKNDEIINIRSDFGKYNINNYDTIFSKNVMIDYNENKIKSDYLDFSLVKNKMIISKNVIYNNIENTLMADNLEMNIITKETIIYMHDKDKKVKIRSN